MCAFFRGRSDGQSALRSTRRSKVKPILPRKGFGGASVLEILTEERGGTWRAVYTVRFREAIYVLHAFQKKSKRGIATPQVELDMIQQRLAEAGRLHKERSK